MAKNVGCHSNMNDFPIFDTGVDVWTTLIGTVRSGLKVMEHWIVGRGSMDHGFELHQHKGGGNLW